MGIVDALKGNSAERQTREREQKSDDPESAHRQLASMTGPRSAGDDQTTRDLQAFWQKMGMVPNTSLIPKSGETVLGQRLNVTHCRIRQTKVRTGGGNLGLSVKLAGGIWAHPHIRTPASYHTETKIQADDVGSLFLTDRRLYFGGSLRNIEIRLDKLALLPRWTNEGYLMIGATKHDEIFKVGDKKAAQAWVAILSRLIPCEAV